MKIPVVEQWMIDEAKEHNPCSIPYKAGQSFSEVALEHIQWAENRIKDFAKRIKSKFPIWIFGYGDGYGNGNGYGDGNFYKNFFKLT